MLKNGVSSLSHSYEIITILWNSRGISIFPTENHYLFEKRFYQSDLGKLYSTIPRKELIKEFGIKENMIGRPIVFPVQGRITLMFLKNYSSLSDKKLVEQLNGYIEWQLVVLVRFVSVILVQTVPVFTVRFMPINTFPFAPVLHTRKLFKNLTFYLLYKQ